jgi:Mrp family chromosome partitioning ATPase/uncharacterized protein involved in exopolysaccharide biosynthesis
MLTQSSKPVESSTAQIAPGFQAPLDFWRTAYAAVRGRQRWVLAITASGAALGAGIGLLAGQRLYTATGLVRLASTLPPVLRETDQNRPMAMFDGFIQAQAQVMSGREVIDAAMKQDAWKKLHASSAATPERFASFLKVETRPRSDFLQVKFTHSDPQVAAAGVQSVIAAYKDVFTNDQEKSESSRMEVLQQRRAELNAQAAKLQASIDQTTHGRTLTEIDALCTETTDRIRKLRGALTDIQIAIEGGPALLEKQSQSAAGSGGSVTEWCTARIFKLECDLVEARAAGLYDTHPRIVQLEKSIKAYREQMAALPHEEQNSDPALAAAERRPLQERENNLRQMVQAAQDELKQFGIEREQLKHLDEQSQALRQQLADTEQRLDALTTESSTGGRLTIVSAGARPMTAVLDNRAKACGAGTLLGAAIPFAGLMVGTLIRRRYRTGEELAEDLGESVPFVTVLPRVDGADHSAALAARSIHAARSRLTQPSGGPRVYLVSSAVAGEGKSSVAMSLSLSLAAAGVRTLLIDADFTSRRLTTALGALDAPGLLEAADNAQEPSLNHLRAGPWVLTAGRAQPRDAGRLRLESLRTLFAGLRQRFDVILIDSDSFLSGVAAPFMAPHADGVILTVGSGARQKHVHQAVRHARQIGVPFMGAVFNYAGLSQFPPELRLAASNAGARALPASASAFGPLVGAILESLSLTREDDLRLAPSGMNLHTADAEREADAAQRRQQSRSAA